MTASPRIPTVLCIDVEPGGHDARAGESLPGFDSMLEYMERLRDRIGEVTATAPRFAWFLRMDPQIEGLYGSPTWIADRYGQVFDRLRAAGDVLGTHTHAWRKTPESGQDWIADWGDLDWADACVDMTLDAFATAFGQPCLIHRFGDRYCTGRLLARLAARGVRVDLTVEPGARSVGALYRGWRATAGVPDQARAPRVPYVPSPDDPLRASVDPATGDLWQLPLTAVDLSGSLPLWRRVARAVRYPGRVQHRPVVLWAPGPVGPLWDAVERSLAGSVNPYLAFAFRSDVLLQPRDAAALRDRIDGLLRSSLAERLTFVDPISAVTAAVAAPSDATPSPIQGIAHRA